MATKNENKIPWIATHPGTILQYELEERKISQKDFAVMIGMQKSHLNELIKGKRPMTQMIADKIENALGISSVSLVNLQNQYDYDKRIIEKKSVEEQEANNFATNALISSDEWKNAPKVRVNPFIIQKKYTNGRMKNIWING